MKTPEPSRAAPKILVIDDVRVFPFEGAVYARTAEEGIERLKEGPWDEVWFDHDLGAAWVDGKAVTVDIWPAVDWVVENKPEIGHAYVHTWNYSGGIFMMEALSPLYKTTRVNNLPVGTTSIKVEY